MNIELGLFTKSIRHLPMHLGELLFIYSFVIIRRNRLWLCPLIIINVSPHKRCDVDNLFFIYIIPCVIPTSNESRADYTSTFFFMLSFQSINRFSIIYNTIYLSPRFQFFSFFMSSLTSM